MHGSQRTSKRLDAPLVARPEPPLPAGLGLRELAPGDGEPLGALMVAAYAGTTDDGGEPPAYHHDEARGTLAGRYGPVRWPASLVAVEPGGAWAGATVVTRDRGVLLLAFALVVPAWRGRGVGAALIVRSANALAGDGCRAWSLAVTVGNPAERLNARLGFRDAHAALTRPVPRGVSGEAPAPG